MAHILVLRGTKEENTELGTRVQGEIALTSSAMFQAKASAPSQIQKSNFTGWSEDPTLMSNGA